MTTEFGNKSGISKEQPALPFPVNENFVGPNHPLLEEAWLLANRLAPLLARLNPNERAIIVNTLIKKVED